MRIEPSGSWTLGSTLLDPGVPSCKWTKHINSTSDNSATSLPDKFFRRPSNFSPTANRTTHHGWIFHSWSTVLFMDLWVYTSRPSGSPWIRIRQINSASDDSAISFLDNLFWRSSCLSPTTTRTHIHSRTFIPVLISATQYLICL